MLARTAMLALYLGAAAAQQAEEAPVAHGTSFLLLAKGGRCLATSLDDSAVELVSGCEARLASGGAGWRVAWTSLRAPDNRLYLQSGDVLLRALDDESMRAPRGETEDQMEERIARSAQWRIRGSDARAGEVALESTYGTFLRRTSGAVEQGRDPADDSVWWVIKPIPERCPVPTLGTRLASALSQYGWPMEETPSPPSCGPAPTSALQPAPVPVITEPKPSAAPEPAPAPQPQPKQPEVPAATRADPAPKWAEPPNTTPPEPIPAPMPAAEPVATKPARAGPKSAGTSLASVAPLGRRRRGLVLPQLALPQLRLPRLRLPAALTSLRLPTTITSLCLPESVTPLRLREAVASRLPESVKALRIPDAISSLSLPTLPSIRLPSLVVPSFSPRGIYALTTWLVLLSTAAFSGGLTPQNLAALWAGVLGLK